MPECANCGTTVPATARFCHECGRPLGEEGERSLSRLAVPAALVAAVLLALAGGALFVLTHWAWGLVALLGAFAVLLVAGPLRDPDARMRLADLRTRASVTREAVAARSREHVDVFRARRELADLEAERGVRLRELGAAVYDGDQAGTKAATEALDDIVRRIRDKEAEIETRHTLTEERVERAQAQARPTVVLEAPPEPPDVPEPWPPPDEADRPSPDPSPDPGPPEPSPGTDEPGSPLGR